MYVTLWHMFFVLNWENIQKYDFHGFDRFLNWISLPKCKGSASHFPSTLYTIYFLHFWNFENGANLLPSIVYVVHLLYLSRRQIINTWFVSDFQWLWVWSMVVKCCCISCCKIWFQLLHSVTSFLLTWHLLRNVWKPSKFTKSLFVTKV